MKITYILESLSLKGGVEGITVDKMNYLSQMEGYDVKLIEVYDYNSPACYELSDKVEVVRLGIRKRRSMMLKPFTFWKVCRMVRRAVVDLDTDIAICSALLGNILFSTTKFNCKTIYESHGPRHRMMLKFLLPRLEKRCDVVVTLTQGDKEEYKVARRVAVIPNFCNIKVTSHAQLSSRHCLFVGRLSSEKNIPRLLRVWKEISERNRDWILDIVGDGPLKVEISRMIESMGLSDSVMMHGSTKNISSYYENSSILLMTSKFEGFPLVLVESLRYGLPAVVFNCPYGPRNILKDGEDGFLIPYDDDDSMVETVCCLMDDGKLRREMGEKGKKNSLRFDIDNVMKQWIKLFKELHYN